MGCKTTKSTHAIRRWWGELFLCSKRIDRAFEHALQLPLNSGSCYVIISDCHRGEGTMNDNFLKNQNLYYAALECYFKRGFCYLELGDGEELWENRSVLRIRRCHEEVYRLFSCMEREERILRLYGNHDMELKDELPEAVCIRAVLPQLKWKQCR